MPGILVTLYEGDLGSKSYYPIPGLEGSSVEISPAIVFHFGKDEHSPDKLKIIENLQAEGIPFQYFDSMIHLDVATFSSIEELEEKALKAFEKIDYNSFEESKGVTNSFAYAPLVQEQHKSHKKSDLGFDLYPSSSYKGRLVGSTTLGADEVLVEKYGYSSSNSLGPK